MILSSLAALLFCTAFAAERTVVSGVVLDASTREGEPAAVLQFFNAADADTPVAYVITDMDGTFSQELPGEGTYTLIYTGVGRQDCRVDFTLNGEESLNLGEILIEDDVEALEAASVMAQRTLVKMEVDRMS